jgi:hypothetical protein
MLCLSTFQKGSYFGTSQNRIEVQQYGQREKMFISFSLSKECLLLVHGIKFLFGFS